MKRLTYLFHHWLGIGMCLLMAMWFFSGIVMMYVQYPTLTAEERLTGLPPLTSEQVRFSPQQILDKQGIKALSQLKLSSIIERPAYIIQTANRQSLFFFADTSEEIKNPSQEDLLTSANLYAQRHKLKQNKTASHKSTLDKDQWTVTGYVNNQHPFHLIKVNDKADTQLYYSVKTGELIRDTNRKERVWNWLGANIHWLYPTIIRQYPKFWYWLIVVLSTAGLISIFTGAIVGWWRIKVKKRYKNNRLTPYTGQMKLHHIMGLLFLIPITTYTYSGLMSMGSFGVPKEKTSYFEQLKAYQGEKKLGSFSQSTKAIQQVISAHPEARELVWYWVDGEEKHYLLDKNNQRIVLDNNSPSQRQEQAIALLKNILPKHTYQMELLEQYDRYYYAHHLRQPKLPALRLKFDDVDKSWFYIDLATGELINRQTQHSRTMRWLYKGLHSLDFPVLINNRPLWDAVVIVLNTLGFIFSVSTIVIAWRYLRNPKKRRLKFFKKRRQTLETNP